MHQFAGRIIDIDEQSALRPAILEPPMLGAVDLDQLAPAVPAIARLVRTRAPRFAILPQTRLDHQPLQCLARDFDAMALDQILARQRWSKIRIMLTNDAKNTLTKRIAMPPIARSAALAGNETGSAIGSQAFQQPENLAALQAEYRRGIVNPKLAAFHAHQRIKSRKFAMAHRQHRHTMRVLVAENGYDTGDPPIAPQSAISI